MRKRVASINEAAISPGLCASAHLCASSSVYISMRTSMLMACWRGEAPRTQAWLVLFTHMRACGWGVGGSLQGRSRHIVLRVLHLCLPVRDAGDDAKPLALPMKLSRASPNDCSTASADPPRHAAPAVQRSAASPCRRGRRPPATPGWRSRGWPGRVESSHWVRAASSATDCG